jgi:hypothetical protein
VHENLLEIMINNLSFHVISEWNQKIPRKVIEMLNKWINSIFECLCDNR